MELKRNQIREKVAIQKAADENAEILEKLQKADKKRQRTKTRRERKKNLQATEETPKENEETTVIRQPGSLSGPPSPPSEVEQHPRAEPCVHAYSPGHATGQSQFEHTDVWACAKCHCEDVLGSVASVIATCFARGATVATRVLMLVLALSHLPSS